MGNAGWIILAVRGAAGPVADDDLQRPRHAAPALPAGFLRHRRAAQAAPRPHSQPGGDGQRLRGPRAGHARRRRQARNAAMAAHGPAAQAQAEGLLQGALRQLFALAEAYPDLKANQNFQQLQAELSDLENKIAAARRFFNNAAAEYNATREELPGRSVRPVHGLRPAGLLQPGGGRAGGRAEGARGEILRGSLSPCPLRAWGEG